MTLLESAGVVVLTYALLTLGVDWTSSPRSGSDYALKMVFVKFVGGPVVAVLSGLSYACRRP
jgi:hypothetical protein